MINETIPLRFNSKSGKVRPVHQGFGVGEVPRLGRGTAFGAKYWPARAVLSGCVPWAPKERKGVGNGNGNAGCARMETEDIEAGPGLRGTSPALDGVRLHRRAGLRTTPAA